MGFVAAGLIVAGCTPREHHDSDLPSLVFLTLFCGVCDEGSR